jgi:NDP-sugar pyrophosphorylase family protein
LKPLVHVAGQTLVERVLTSIGEIAPIEVVVIINEHSIAIEGHVTGRQWPFPLRWIVETTPSSMHSFLRVVEMLAADGDEGPFVISTVDTVAAPGAYAQFAAASARVTADVTLAVTSTWDDEKPLLVRVADDGRVTEIGLTREPDEARGVRLQPDQQIRLKPDPTTYATTIYATAGYYCVRSSILREAAGARADGLSALRLFLGRLVTRGYHIAAVPVPDGIDVDRPADISAAEAFLKQVRA